MVSTRLTLVFAALCALLAPQAAPAQGYTLQKIVATGDPAPGGGTLQHIVSNFADFDDAGRFIFTTWTGPNPTTSPHRVFVHNGVSLVPVLGTGTPVPGAPGQVFFGVYAPHWGAGGSFTWAGDWGSGLIGPGLFRRAGAVDSALVLPGQPAPGGGSFVSIQRVDDQNDQGDVLFCAKLDTGYGLFLWRTTGIEAIARDGDPVPGAAGTTLVGLCQADEAGLAADGSVAFGASLQPTNIDSPNGAFLRAPGGSVTTLLLPGSPAPTAEGGTVYFVRTDVSMSPQGDAFVDAIIVLPGSDLRVRRVYAMGSAGTRVIAEGNQVLPGTSGGQLAWLEDRPRGNTAGGVALVPFWMNLGSNRVGLFVSRPGVPLWKIVVKDDPAPGLPGRTILSVDRAWINASGQIGFAAGVSGVGDVLYVATPVATEVPLVPPLALGVLGALLLAHTRLVRPCQNGSRSWRLRILPEPVRGSSGANVMERGTL
jgi:hypothetical protein